MKDKYDVAVEYLTGNPKGIQTAWTTGYCSKGKGISPGACLFQAISSTGGSRVTDYGPCGCLTLIRGGSWVAETPGLTADIVADDRIPSDPLRIRVADLPVFAEWQRKADAVLGRTG